MGGFSVNLENATLNNQNFRQVLYTGVHSQLVVMSLEPGEEIGMEVHPTIDQFVRVEKGSGKAIIGSSEYTLKDGNAVVIPAGSYHNIMNTSQTEQMKLYTVYSPANHPAGTVHKTRADAKEAERAER